MKSKYAESYDEIQVLGRGAFGVAYLVADKKNTAQKATPNRYHVAKKVFLSGISQEEKSKSIQ